MRERERERERGVKETGECVCERGCVCVCERERGGECVCERGGRVCERERRSV